MIKSNHMDFANMDVLMGKLAVFLFVFLFYKVLSNTYLATLFTAQFVDISVKN